MQMTCEAVKRYTIPVRDDGGVEQPGEVLDKLVRAFMREHGERDYSVAFDAVRANPSNAEALRKYAAS
jgi:hypothetical protein